MPHKIIQEDMEYICKADNIQWDKLRNKTLLITGGTGLIGSTLIRGLLLANKERQLGLKIKLIVRSLERVKEVFEEAEASDECMSFICKDLDTPFDIEGDVDYIIHGASPTASAYFASHPVETIKAGIMGTMNLLELAVQKKSEAFLFLSSMEIYGKVTTEEILTEDKLGYVDPLTIRSCYPETKRMSEALTASYAHEYGIRAMNIRLAQTFGPGVLYDDQRVFAMMARCAMNGENIQLLTKGKSKHPYLYTAQAATAILTVLLSGQAGKSYNAANPDTYCSIAEMGEMVAEKLCGGKIAVTFAENGDTSKYPDTTFLNLSIDAITALGWKPEGDLADIYRRMMEVMEAGR